MNKSKFTYNGHEIDFVPTGETNVMVNATEMARAFGKETREFLRNQNTKNFIEVAESELYSVGNYPLNNMKMVENRSRNGIYFHRILALKFAAWLSPEFELWVYQTIDNILFGSYLEFRQAEFQKLQAQIRLQERTDQLVNQYPELAEFFALQAELKSAGNRSTTSLKAVRNQLKLELFDNL